MKKSLKKVILKIYKNAKETDTTKRTFRPEDYPQNWTRAVKTLDAQQKRLQFNAIFKPLYRQLLNEGIKDYLSAGYKMTGTVRKTLKYNAKQKAKEITKAELASKAAAEQSNQEQENVLSQE